MSNHERKILTHDIFGVEERDLQQTISYNLLSNLKLLGGKNLNLNENEVISNQDLRGQIALEYLIKMFISLDTQTKLGIVKLRSFLLLGKAIMLDLQLLEIKEGKLLMLLMMFYFSEKIGI